MRRLNFTPVKIVCHEGIYVARDDLTVGGTKMRFIGQVFAGVEEVIYATPCEGGAQYALATMAKHLGKRVTLFCAKRKVRHPRTEQALALGANVIELSPGYLSQVQAAAARYLEEYDGVARLLPFGVRFPGAEEAIADAADVTKVATGVDFDEVWCAAGSGLIARGLALSFPKAARYAVQVGHKLKPEDVAYAEIVEWSDPFKKTAPELPPFPSDPHYDAKAWLACRDFPFRRRGNKVLFWNVAAPAPGS